MANLEILSKSADISCCGYVINHKGSMQFLIYCWHFQCFNSEQGKLYNLWGSEMSCMYHLCFCSYQYGKRVSERQSFMQK